VPDGEVVALAELEGVRSDGVLVDALDELGGDDGTALLALDEPDGGAMLLAFDELDGGVMLLELDELDGDEGVVVVALDELDGGELDGGADGAVVVVEEVLVLSRSTERSQAVRASALAIARDISIGFMGLSCVQAAPGRAGTQSGGVSGLSRVDTPKYLQAPRHAVSGLPDTGSGFSL
jgi:hypothetical protein